MSSSLESLSLKWADYGLFNHEDFGKPWWDLKALSGLELPNLRTFKMLLPAKCSNFGPSFQSLVHRLPDTLDFLAIYFPLDESMRTFKFPQDMEQTFAKFRELQAFHIKVPMFLDNHGQLIDPTPISNMLRNLHSLRHVTVATSHSGEIPVELLRDWMERCYSGISLPIPAPPITFRIL
ncbi:hypothetical protein H0H93_010127 [Arthromyces matolae]|nr:hypothetical protein H0H93_010127 [Arthromyces matolae]